MVVPSPQAMDVDETKASPDADETMASPEEPRWNRGDRVHAVWAGNGCYYPATVVSCDNEKVSVHWDDEHPEHREVPINQVCEPNADSHAWEMKRIDRRAQVRDTEHKGRCLFVVDACEPGQVVFVEKPTLVALPALEPMIWERMKKLHEAQPLQLGTVTFHYAAIVSQLHLPQEDIDVIMDKYVPDPNEAPGEDVIRILAGIQDVIPQKHRPVLTDPSFPQRLQRLVSAWRYNSFGHHKEDGLVLYNRISMCAHSCDPSCCWSYGEEDAFVLRARTALDKGAELTISYLQDEDLLKSTAVRQQKLQNWKFTCACTRCALQIDTGRGFRCRRCRVGIHFARVTGSLEPCLVCNAVPSDEDTKMLLQLEEEYVARVDGLDKTDTADVELVFQAAIDIFERHWILYVMDTMLWEAYREKRTHDAMEHQRRRIEFHEHYYGRPTFILAWCHEEFGDCLQAQYPNRRWQFMQEFQHAYQMLAILCGTNHQYTASPYTKFLKATQNEQKKGQNKAAVTNGVQG
jgi:hypothetical protein